MQMVRKMPTPTDTVRISMVLSMPGTFWARTCRSGSAMVMTTPRTKASTRMSHRRRDLVIFAPTRLPIWVMDSSAPSVNRPMPKISMTAPTRKASISPLPTGTKKKHSTATIRVMGSTESTASFSLLLMILRLVKITLLLSSLIVARRFPVRHDKYPRIVYRKTAAGAS